MNGLRTLLKAPIFSPKGFAIRAGVLILLFLALHLAGYRDYTCIVCGTSPTGDLGDGFSAGMGVAYILLYFGAWLGAPILVTASAILYLLLRRFPPDPVPVSPVPPASTALPDSSPPSSPASGTGGSPGE